MVLLTMAVVAGVSAVVAGVVTGGLGEPADSIPARALPTGPLTGQDVADLRFVQSFRGYRMDQVDAAMDSLAAEVERLRALLPESARGTGDGPATVPGTGFGPAVASGPSAGLTPTEDAAPIGSTGPTQDTGPTTDVGPTKDTESTPDTGPTPGQSAVLSAGPAPAAGPASTPGSTSVTGSASVTGPAPTAVSDSAPAPGRD